MGRGEAVFLLGGGGGGGGVKGDWRWRGCLIKCLVFYMA